jgi:hypothetical protein
MSWMAKGIVVQFLAGALSMQVKWLRQKAKNSLPFNTEVKNEKSYSSTPTNAFIVCTEQLYLIPLHKNV